MWQWLRKPNRYFDLTQNYLIDTITPAMLSIIQNGLGLDHITASDKLLSTLRGRVRYLLTQHNFYLQSGIVKNSRVMTSWINSTPYCKIQSQCLLNISWTVENTIVIFRIFISTHACPLHDDTNWMTICHCVDVTFDVKHFTVWRNLYRRIVFR